jgi:hypothetical protein
MLFLSTVPSRVRRELACHRYEPCLNIAEFRKYGFGWVHGVVIQMCDCHLTLGDGRDLVEVKLRPADRRLYAGMLAAVRGVLAAGRYPGVAVKLRYNPPWRSTTIFRARWVPPEDRRDLFKLLRRDVKLCVGG